MSGRQNSSQARQIRFVADDYALSPGVSHAIRELISLGKLSGTGCMTLFEEWRSEAPKLKALCNDGLADAGLHLTLTDFEPLSGSGPLGTGAMPAIGTLIKAAMKGAIDEAAVERELDAQLEAFTDAFGRLPDYFDGHQHVHFLRPVRTWFAKRATHFASAGQMPWLRGAPSIRSSGGIKMMVKTAVVGFMAAGFDNEMRKAGYRVRGPLTGFYDWQKPEGFVPMLRKLETGGLAKAVVMCHPGFADDTLRRRDQLIEAREAEFAVLRDYEF